jgi:hypothetical protein
LSATAKLRLSRSARTIAVGAGAIAAQRRRRPHSHHPNARTGDGCRQGLAALAS